MNIVFIFITAKEVTKILLNPLFLAIIMFSGLDLYACPIFFHAYQLDRNIGKENIQRNTLSFYVLDAANKTWHRQPLQINAVDKFGNIDFDSKFHGPEFELNHFDRLAIAKNSLTTTRWKKSKNKPCDSKKVYEISISGKYGYIFQCKKALEPESYLIDYDEKNRTVFSPRYTYIHDDSNHLSFTKIKFKQKKKSIQDLVAFDAEQLIFADVKNFFSMSFRADDVSATLQKKIDGQLGMIGLLQFYLRILFFKIELALTPEVQFYEESIFMPMSLFSPVDAKKYLNEGSGIFYSWKSPEDIKWFPSQKNIPFYAGKSKFHKMDKTYCRGRRCFFELTGLVGEEMVTLSFSIDRSLANLNFYPQFITDFSGVNKIYDRKISKSPEKRMGVFFETSSLPEGNHYWDFWITFSQNLRGCQLRPRIVKL